MPHIANFNPAKVPTPLQPQFPELVTSFLRLSPRSRGEAERIIHDRSIRFSLDATTNQFLYQASAFRTDVGLELQQFKVGLRSMERTWAAVFGYSVLFHWSSDLFNAQTTGKNVPQPAALSAGVASLRWAFSKQHTENDYPWPKSIPAPSWPYSDATLMQRVTPTALRAIGWILLHELGHFERLHLEPAPETEPLHQHDEEHEADAWASNLATTPLDSDLTKANLVSIPFALGTMAGINRKETNEHPAVVERLRRFFSAHVEPLSKIDAILYNTVLLATTTPLQALLHLRDWSPDGFVPLRDLDEYLRWWELEMDKLESADH